MKITGYKITKYIGSRLRVPRLTFKTYAHAHKYGRFHFGVHTFRRHGGWDIKAVISRIVKSARRVRRPRIRSAKGGFNLMNPYLKLAKEGKKRFK